MLRIISHRATGGEVRRVRGPYFRPGVALVFKIVLALLLAAGIFAAGMSWARDRHEARTARLRVCEAELRELRARNPFVDRFVRPADSCIALAVVRGER